MPKKITQFMVWMVRTINGLTEWVPPTAKVMEAPQSNFHILFTQAINGERFAHEKNVEAKVPIDTAFMVIRDYNALKTMQPKPDVVWYTEEVSLERLQKELPPTVRFQLLEEEEKALEVLPVLTSA